MQAKLSQESGLLLVLVFSALLVFHEMQNIINIILWDWLEAVAFHIKLHGL